MLTVGIAVRPRRRPRALWPGLPVPPAPSAAVGPGVLLWLAPSLPCMRYKVRPARFLAGDSGIKFALRAKNVPIWAILSEQGEFYPAHAVRRGVQGEFCTGHAVRRGVQGEFCTGHAVRRGVQGDFCIAVARRGSCWASFVPPLRLPCVQLPGFRRPRAPQPGPPASSTPMLVGVLQH